MRLELTGRQITITPALRRMVEAKLVRLERMLNDSALSAQVVLCREKRGHRADVTLHARGEKFLHAVGSPAATWETSTTQAVDRIVQQAQRIKGKWEDRKRRSPKAPEAPPGVGERARARSVSTAARSMARTPRVLTASRQAVKAMSVADAAREIDAYEEGIIVFRDAETAGISVLYRRASGELALVQTEA
jgi:putative sigma-54 modulation protein